MGVFNCFPTPEGEAVVKQEAGAVDMDAEVTTPVDDDDGHAVVVDPYGEQQLLEPDSQPRGSLEEEWPSHATIEAEIKDEEIDGMDDESLANWFTEEDLKVDEEDL